MCTLTETEKLLLFILPRQAVLLIGWLLTISTPVLAFIPPLRTFFPEGHGTSMILFDSLADRVINPPLVWSELILSYPVIPGDP